MTLEAEVPVQKEKRNRSTPKQSIHRLRRSNMFVRTWHGGEKTALLIHGLASSSTTWRKLAVYLQKEGYTVIAPDLSGHGFSPRKKKYTIEGWTEEVLSLGIKPDLVIGHSAGGLVAANAYRGLGQPQTALIDPVFKFPHIKGMKFLAQRIFTIVQYSMLWQSVRAFSGDNKRDLAFVVQALKLWDYRTSYALDYYRDIRRNFIIDAEHSLIIRSEKSFISPRYLLNHSREGRVVIESFNGVRHNIHWDAFDTLIDSLQRHMGIGTPQTVAVAQYENDLDNEREAVRDAFTTTTPTIPLTLPTAVPVTT